MPLSLSSLSCAPGASLDAIADAARASCDAGDAKLWLVFASPSYSLATVLEVFTRLSPSAVVMGATTSGEFNEVTTTRGGLAAVSISGDLLVRAGMGRNLRLDAEAAVMSATAELPTASDEYPHRTALLLLDPLSGVGEEATLLTADVLGATARLAGGAAGDDLAMKQTFVGLGAEVASDAMVTAVLLTKVPLGVGVCHGHEPLSEPLQVTRAEGAVVYEVDGRPAWDVWRDETRRHASARGVDVDSLPDSEVGGYLLRYEAGLKAGEAYKVRAPLGRGEDGSLTFACGIPEGAQIQITDGEPARQVSAAREAARRARAQLGGLPVSGAVVFDCICRNLILGDEFSEAVRGISDELGGVPLGGFETYGEIALDAGDMSGFHNTTTVVLVVPAA